MKPDTALQVALATLVLVAIQMVIVVYFIAAGGVVVIDP